LRRLSSGTVAALVAVFVPSMLLAQARQITGRVTAGGSQEPLAGASVSVSGTTVGAYTGEDGRFRISVNAENVQLVVRRIGFKRKTVDVPATQTGDVDIALERDALKLEELVITGQGTQVARQNLANDVASVSAAELTRVQASSLESALAGKIAGANIQMNSGAPGGGGQVQIRGITSLNASSDPLWVVDGVIVSNDVLNSGLTAVTRSSGITPTSQDNSVNRIADLNMNDIERIEVLKGASASSIYGARAANGVIVITTRRGESGRPQYSFTQRVGTFQQLRTLGSRNYTLDEAIATFTGPGTVFGTNVDSLRRLYGNGQVFDNEKNFFGETPFSYETAASVSGGNDATRYFASGLHKYDGGIMPNTGARRQSLRLNFSQLATQKLTFDLRSSVMRSRDRRGVSNNDNSGTSPYVVFAKTPNFFDLRPRGGAFPVNPFDRSNPFQTMALSKLEENVDRFLVQGTATYQALTTARNSIELRIDGGADRLNQKDNIFTPPELQFEPLDGLPGTVAFTSGAVQNANLNALLTHRFTPSSRINATGSFGVQREVRNLEFVNVVNRDLVAGQGNVDRGTTSNLQENRQPTKVFAYFAQEEVLLFNEKLLLTGGLRAERNTNNGDVEKMYFFPKASASYRLPAFGGLDAIKLRMAWGRSGNQPLYPQKFTPLTPSVYGGVNALRVGTTAGDPTIKPEVQTELEGGIDIGLANGRAALTLTAFDKRVDDLIIQPTFAPSSGFTNQFINGAGLQNRGVEATLALTPLRFRQGEWNSHVNFQKVEPKITRLDVPTFRQGGFGGLGQYQIENGKSPTQIVGPVPSASNPNVSALAVIGDATPDFQIAFDNELRFGSFRVGGLLDWKEGGHTINLTEVLFDASRNTSDYEAKGEQRRINQSRDVRPYVQRSGFLKLRELTVGYTVAQSMVERLTNGQVRSMRVDLTGRNLWMSTEYRGLDPEVSNFGNQALARGIDVAPFPPSRSMFLSLALGF
jgi:TonB-dependent starch-binding outer membrane protein SusC